jgi:hypothetical protein
MSAIDIARAKAMGQNVIVYSKYCTLVPETFSLNPAKAPRKRGK